MILSKLDLSEWFQTHFDGHTCLSLGLTSCSRCRCQQQSAKFAPWQAELVDWGHIRKCQVSLSTTYLHKFDPNRFHRSDGRFSIWKGFRSSKFPTLIWSLEVPDLSHDPKNAKKEPPHPPGGGGGGSFLAFFGQVKPAGRL